MLVFSTQSSLHLAKLVAKQRGFVLGKWESYHFSDGELYVRIKTAVHGKKVLIIGSTEAPAENLIELLFLIRAVQEGGGFPRIFVPYLGYARANSVQYFGEPHRLRYIAELFVQTGCPISILDIHSEESMNLFSGKVANFSATHELCAHIKKYINKQDCIIVAPDYGARKRAARIAATLGLSEIVVLKKRRSGTVVRIEKPRISFENKTAIIVDDIFDTGSTLFRAVEIIKELRARHVYGLVTHGIFSKNPQRALAKSPIEKLFVTNSLRPRLRHRKVEYIDIHESLINREF